MTDHIRAAALTNLPADLEVATRPSPPAQAPRPTLCPVCLQTYDLNDIEQCYHHTADDHAPMD